MRSPLAPPVIGWLLAGSLLLGACAGSADPGATAGVGPAPTAAASETATPQQAPRAAVAGVPTGDVLRAVEVARRPHDPTAFTQGLEFDDGRLFESRGLYADQEDVVLTEIDPADGRTIRQVDRPAEAPFDAAFHEGLTVVDDRIIQLTWRQGAARVYDVDSLEPTGTFTYEGEGWGICDQVDPDTGETVLLMTDGTPTLTHRDPETFAVLDEVTVRDAAGQPVDELNEVECAGGLVWANVWQTNRIVVIDPSTGAVRSEVDASAFADARGRYVEGGADVLNGIAFDPRTGTWLLTGKLWPWMFEVEFECVEGCRSAVTPTHFRRAT